MDAGEVDLVVPRQVVDEFTRNRERIIKENQHSLSSVFNANSPTSALPLALHPNRCDNDGAARMVVSELHRVPINKGSLDRSIAVLGDDGLTIKPNHA
jgi:hypothetical protein